MNPSKPSFATAVLCFIAPFSLAETIITIQPHTNGEGYVVTYSWKGRFANGMDGGSNRGNAYIDDNTTTVSSNFVMTSGNHAGGLIRYSQHNNNGINGDLEIVPPLGPTPVHYDGTNGESLIPGNPMSESSHSNIGFVENGGDWYNNPNDQGGVRFFGTGIQGAESLTSWNGIDSNSAYGNVQFEGENLLGQGMQFGVNGSFSGSTDSARFGMVGDAGYWRNLDNAGENNGLLIGYFPYANNLPFTGDKFTDQFNVGTYTSANEITLQIVNDPGHVPWLVEEEGTVSFRSWSGGVLFDDDANDDGVSNGLAFLLGAADPNANARGLLPTAAESEGGLVLTFSCRNLANRGGATLRVEHSSDLGNLDAWTAVEVPEVSGGPVSGVRFTVSVNPTDPSLNDVVATISSTEAVAGKLTGRFTGEE